MKKQLLPLLLILVAPIMAEEWAYFGEKGPGDQAVIFAEGIVSTDSLEHSSPSFTPDLRKVFWQVREDGRHVIKYSYFEHGSWTPPRILELKNESRVDSPFVSHDGSFLYYASRCPLPNEEREGDHNVWMFSLLENSQEPTPFGSPLNSDNLEISVSQCLNGNLYFLGNLDGVEGNMGIFRAISDGGFYHSPDALSGKINSKWLDWTPWIDPNEGFLLFSSHRPGGFGSGDLYVSFKRDDDTFSDPVNLGPQVNTRFQERFPSISPDGKFLFFTRNNEANNHDVYWISVSELLNRARMECEQNER